MKCIKSKIIVLTLSMTALSGFAFGQSVASNPQPELTVSFSRSAQQLVNATYQIRDKFIIEVVSSAKYSIEAGTLVDPISALPRWNPAFSSSYEVNGVAKSRCPTATSCSLDHHQSLATGYASSTLKMDQSGVNPYSGHNNDYHSLEIQHHNTEGISFYGFQSSSATNPNPVDEYYTWDNSDLGTVLSILYAFPSPFPMGQSDATLDFGSFEADESCSIYNRQNVSLTPEQSTQQSSFEYAANCGPQFRGQMKVIEFGVSCRDDNWYPWAESSATGTGITQYRFRRVDVSECVRIETKNANQAIEIAQTNTDRD